MLTHKEKTIIRTALLCADYDQWKEYEAGTVVGSTWDDLYVQVERKLRQITVGWSINPGKEDLT